MGTKYLRPHPDEARSAVSKDGRTRCPSFETPRYARLLRMRSERWKASYLSPQRDAAFVESIRESQNLSPLAKTALSFLCLARRRRRLKRRRMTERGAAPDNVAAVKRRGGAGSPDSGPARPEAADPGNRTPPWCAAGVRQSPARGRPVSVSAPPPALHPSFRGTRKKGDGPFRRARRQSRRTAERWLNAHQLSSAGTRRRSPSTRPA